MNRKERRAAQRSGQGGVKSGALAGEQTERMFAQAVRLRQNNELESADMTCRTILAAHPNHAGSLHLRGTIALQLGRPDLAADFIGKAIAARNDIAAFHDDMGFALHALGRTDDAIAHHRRAIEIDPDNAQAHINLAVKLLARGQRDAAAVSFIKAMELMPAVFEESYPNVKATLFKLNPALEAAVVRATNAWPRRLPIEELFGADGYRTAAGDRALSFVLASSPVRDLPFEKLLTCIRFALLQLATQTTADENFLGLCCALARQCFINEYVFDMTPDEEFAADRLKDALSKAIETKSQISPIWIAAVGSYFSLDTIANATALLDRAWPAEVDAVLTQQLREPIEERQIRPTIPRLSSIEDATSQLVRQQYEESPYPRWVLQPYPKLAPVPIESYFEAKFPLSPLLSRAEQTMDVLIAGCGTGKHPMIIAKMFTGAKTLAVDLSLASLSYAQRQMRKFGIANFSFAQADILTLGSLGRTFDLVDSSGVLHHLADPVAGLRSLVSMVRPRGFMRIGLYSELARRNVAAAREYCAKRGYRPTARDIRTARHDLLGTEFKSIEQSGDFYSTSECRDLLFHVQEHRFSIAQIKELLDAHNLSFIGFELTKAVFESYRAQFPADPAMRQLENWQTFETERPSAFVGMYQFWVQKP